MEMSQTCDELLRSLEYELFIYQMTVAGTVTIALLIFVSIVVAICCYKRRLSKLRRLTLIPDLMTRVQILGDQITSRGLAKGDLGENQLDFENRA